MSEATRTNTAGTTIPIDASESLLIDGTDVRTKVGHVAKFNQDGDNNDLDDNIVLDDLDNYKKPKGSNEFVGLTKEELKQYIDNPKWKHVRLLIAILYILLLVLLLVGSILLIVFSPGCPPKPKLHWYQKEIIYEIDVMVFRDSNADGIGDIKGVQENLNYFEKNNIKSILFQSTIFNVTGGTSLHLDGQRAYDKNIDLLQIDPLVGSDNDLQDLLKIFNRRDMHFIIDLPLSSILDPNGKSWYGSTPLLNKIDNPCTTSAREPNFGCMYYKSYGRLPLDFSDDKILEQATDRLRHWFSSKKVDGIRVDLPLFWNKTTRSYDVSYKAINQWNDTKNEIEKNSKPKLLLMDIPFGLQDLITNRDLSNQVSHPLFIFKDQTRPSINAHSFDQRIRLFEGRDLSKPQFWQLGSKRRSDDVGIVHENQLPREIVLTTIMLLGGTPVVLYGEEIGLNQKSFPLMPWKSTGEHRGFSSCSANSTNNCKSFISSLQTGNPTTSVKRQEALGGQSQDSLLTVFRYLSKLREYESFQFGLLEYGYDQNNNIFWFIREAPGHRGYVTVFNLNQGPDEKAHISLYDLTKADVPSHVHYEYQWPKAHLSTSRETRINSDNLFIHPQSVNIFWWGAKLQKPNILFKTVKEHSQNH
ncbi:unnamed protein product [Rotaria socialis]|uniref:Glycosyl hydrolase family 13 catalytic domain-containing protein n=1 Tax=Rotaria socialis TaxID=392032 RepID=A0A821IUH7_9BILA|nr:unnamed protein product [Rotaria socialis]CAF4704107.1 unnamed protein product [Rotaria socialis]